MAEPLIQVLTRSDSDLKELTSSHSLQSLDDMIEQSLGNFGWMQFLQSLFVSLSMFFDAQQTFITIYTDSIPPWHCTSSSSSSINECSSQSDICNLPPSSWSWDGGLSSKTIISQWGLQCAPSFITGLPQSSFFIGCFLGGFLLSTLADSSLGRKNMLFLSCLTMSISSTLIVFSKNIWVYSAFKLLIGFCRSSIGTCALVLLTESVQKQWRFRVSVIEYVLFTMGFLSLPIIAYLQRNSSWKVLYLWTSLPAILYSILAYLFVSESPRWLIMQGRHEEAIKLLEGNNNNTIDGNVSSFKIQSPSSSSSIRELIQKRWALLRLLAVMILAFGIGMLYFGMPLNVGSLGFNIYMAVVFNAILEIPAFVATFFFDNFKRKPTIFGFAVISGICCVICVLVTKAEVKLALALASFFSVCVSYDVFLIYVVELFPTSVRNTTTALTRLATVFGAVFSPFLVSQGRKNDLFSYGLFGVVILCSSVCVFYLPETKGIALCDTMNQQEKKESLSGVK